MSKLVLFLADGTTFNIPLDRERINIGRRADNEVCLPNLAVSGEHAAIVTILADSFLEDLGSTNGTLVNGNPIVKHFLRDRDEIDVGRHKLVYCVDDGAVLTPEVVAGIARVTARDFGDRVETAKPPARSKRAAASPRSKRDTTAAAKQTTPDAAPADTRAARKPEPQPDPVPAKPDVAADPVASIKLLSGPSAGRAIPITKEKTTIGRAGVQVALISQSGSAFQLQPLEGDAPRVNGSPAAGAIELHGGDVLEIAGRRLEFIVAG